jgi:RimJ/RimL family protein N-acetyltransferase
MAQFTPLSTDRLLIRKLEAGDAAALLAYRGRPEVYRYQFWRPKTMGEAGEFIRSVENTEPDTPDTWLQVAICLKDTGEMIGDAGMHFLPDEPMQAEIGYSIAPERQGRGYAREAVRAILGYLFETLGKHRVTASVDPRNAPSIALLEKLGFRKEAHFRQSVYMDGEWCDDCMYAMLECEWNPPSPTAEGTSL